MKTYKTPSSGMSQATRRHIQRRLDAWPQLRAQTAHHEGEEVTEDAGRPEDGDGDR